MRLISALGLALRADLAAARAFLQTGLLRVLIASLILVVIACRLSLALSPLEYSMLDILLRQRPPGAPDPRIAVVGIEPELIDAHEEERARLAADPAHQGRPACICDTIPRDDIARLVERTRRAGARVVALDLFFTNPCPIRGHNGRLRLALGQGPGEVIVAVEPLPGHPSRYRLPTSEVKGGHDLLLASPLVYLGGGGGVRGVELVQAFEMADYVKEEHLPLEAPVELFPALGAAVYAAMTGHPCDLAEPMDGHWIMCGDHLIPVNYEERIDLLEPLIRRNAPEGRYPMLINWVGPAGSIPMYGASAVLKAEPENLESWFSGKVVILGSGIDRSLTPVRGGARWAGPPFVDQRGEVLMSGPEVHANVVDTMLRGRFLMPVAHSTVWLILILGATLTITAFRSARTATALGVLAVEGGGLLLAANVLITRNVWLYTAIPILTFSVSAALAIAWGLAKSTSHEAQLQRQLRSLHDATATTVHDLKQPLAAINALAAALRKLQEKGRPDSPEILELIEKQVGSALGNIDDLLAVDAARPLRLNSQPFDVAALTRDLATTLGMTSSVHQIEVFPAEGSITLEGDARLIGRVLSNLIDNAIKYSPTGGRITIEVASFPQVAVIRVRDQGMGIPPDQLPGIFDPYVRALPEGMDIPGTGVGLHSVRRMVEAHGGHVTAQSQLGVGSTFTVTLPKVAQPAPSHALVR
ncbi:MAG: CHASE2 domain-containing protein [Armatimonadetes bacterium]|nr:CHASE2 domain-containing protein [Armatimonadota bacterium]